MQNLGVDVIGTNCSLGPDEMQPVVERLLDVCARPVLAEPNAGLPRLENGKTIFPQGPGRICSKKPPDLAQMGTQVLGGCCGTTPEHTLPCLRQASKKSGRGGEKKAGNMTEFALPAGRNFVRIGEKALCPDWRAHHHRQALAD